jgi:uncharacterized membrane protein
MARLSLRERIRGEEKWWHGIGEKFADYVAARAGRVSAIVVHTVWFVVWFASGLDHYPFNFLTLTVSLEAIYLSLFILISQRRSAERDAVTIARDRESQRIALEAVVANSKALLDITEAVRHGMAEQDEILEDLHDALPVPPEAGVCPSCGLAQHGSDVFCSGCGSRVVPPEDAVRWDEERRTRGEIE